MFCVKQVKLYQASQVPFNRSLLVGLVAHILSQSDALIVTGSCICGHRSGGLCSLLGLGAFGNLAPMQQQQLLQGMLNCKTVKSRLIVQRM